MKLLLLLTIIASLLSISYSAKFAVLVAGSYKYRNYRHQADVCHAYQILTRNGIPKDNIVVMAYNDIAHNRKNPFKGQIFNKPTAKGVPGDNVYQGCAIDYQGREVSKHNYQAILTGNHKATQGGTGRVLESGPDDEVFIFFSDHGNAGLVAFPHERMYAPEFNTILAEMQEKQKYKQLTYYLETCYSGSMFVKTPNNVNVYAVSAANTHQNSWATYCSPHSYVNGRNIKSCLGDLFSVSWMENTESVDPFQESLQQQYEIVKKRVTKSEVLQWGDLSIQEEPISTFQAAQQNTTTQKKFGFLSKIQNTLYSTSILNRFNDKKQYQDQGSINNNEVTQQYLLQQFQEEPTEENYQELQEELQATRNFAKIMENFKNTYHNIIVQDQQQQILDTDFECYQHLVNKLEIQFGSINESSYKLFDTLYNFCSTIQQKEYLHVQFSL